MSGMHPEQNNIDDKLREYIKDTLHKEYVDSKLMTENTFTKEVDSWINYI